METQKVKSNSLDKVLVIALAIIVTAFSARAQDAGRADQEEPNRFPFRAVEDKLAPTGWKLYHFGDPVSFSVFLPKQPQALSKKFSSKNEAGIISYLYLAPDEHSLYGVSYMADLEASAKPKSEIEKRISLDDFVRGFADTFSAGLRERGVAAQLEIGVQRKVSVSGIEGYEQEMLIGPYSGRARMVFVHRDACIAFALWLKQSPVSNRTAFFDSFKVSLN